MKKIDVIGSITKIGDGEFGVRVNNFYQRELVKTIEDGKQYAIAIEQIGDRKARSTNQNKYMWKLLSQIAFEVNGDKDSMAIYIQALERANVLSKPMLLPKDADQVLKKIRTYKYLYDDNEHDGYAWYLVFYGSSQMNTKEMSELIDIILDMANEAGIMTDYWKGLLKG